MIIPTGDLCALIRLSTFHIPDPYGPLTLAPIHLHLLINLMIAQFILIFFYLKKYFYFICSIELMSFLKSIIHKGVVSRYQLSFYRLNTAKSRFYYFLIKYFHSIWLMHEFHIGIPWINECLGWYPLLYIRIYGTRCHVKNLSHKPSYIPSDWYTYYHWKVSMVKGHSNLEVVQVDAYGIITQK